MAIRLSSVVVADLTTSSRSESASQAVSLCSISALERVLDAYALGDMPEAMEQAPLQAHLQTCEYCGRLLRSAEEIRSGLGYPRRTATAA